MGNKPRFMAIEMSWLEIKILRKEIENSFLVWSFSFLVKVSK